MSQSIALKKIVWAVDPFAKDSSLPVRVAHALQELQGRDQTEIQPVALVNAAGASQDLLVKTREAAAIRLGEIFKDVELRNLLLPKLLIGNYPSLQDSVREILSFAQSEKADLLALSTHGRSGLQRWMMGSFAETTLLSAPLPLLIVNPRAEHSSTQKKILFATDFSERSSAAYQIVLARAKSIGATVVLFHHVTFLFEPEVMSVVHSPELLTTMAAQQLKERQADAMLWVEKSQDVGVPVQVVIDELNPSQSHAEAILNQITGDISLLAMPALSGNLSTTLVGSTVRQVCRSASVPVWVLRGEEST